MKLGGIGNLSLFLGGLVGVAIGIILLLLDSHTFPILPVGIYRGVVVIDDRENQVVVEVHQKDSIEFVAHFLGQETERKYSAQLVPNHSRFSFGASYLPIQIPLDHVREGSDPVTWIGKSIGEQIYQGELLDANRNNIGKWSLVGISDVVVTPSTTEAKVRSVTSLLHGYKTLDMQLTRLQQENVQLDKDLNRANLLLANLNTLASEGAEKLKEAKIEREQTNHDLKESQAVVDKLSDQILVTQRVSPQSRLYELSLESLRSEKKWFLSKLVSEKSNSAK